MTTEVCETYQKIMQVKANLTWNRMYQDLYDRARKIIKKYIYMKFYSTSRPQNVESDFLGVDLVARLLQVRDGMNCWHNKVPNATRCPERVYQILSGTAAIY